MAAAGIQPSTSGSDVSSPANDSGAHAVRAQPLRGFEQILQCHVERDVQADAEGGGPDAPEAQHRAVAAADPQEGGVTLR